MNWRRVISAITGGGGVPAPAPAPAPAPRQAAQPQAQVVETVPVGRLVSERGGAIRVHALGPGEALPQDRVAYRTSGHGGLVFRFTIVRWSDGSFRAFIREQPSYRGRRTDDTSTHRLRDAGRLYVCWAPAPRSAIDMLRVARLWAEHTARYIATGAPIGG